MKHQKLTAALFALTGILATACGPSETIDAGAPAPAGSDDTPVTTLPADDLPLGGGNLPIVQLDVVVTHPDHPDVSYTVSCLGDTATVIGDVEGIRDFTACERLGNDEVRNRLLNGVPADQICTEQYGGPDFATVTGTYDGVGGEPINTTFDRSDGCGISDWDSVMAGILPAPRGF